MGLDEDVIASGNVCHNNFKYFNKTAGAVSVGWTLVTTQINKKCLFEYTGTNTTRLLWLPKTFL